MSRREDSNVFLMRCTADEDGYYVTAGQLKHYLGTLNEGCLIPVHLNGESEPDYIFLPEVEYTVERL